ncbi:unnamed protein product [Angiostrongylus costaricensis]|uniref:D-lactate dehydratase n=1 Tax=Angiostrongylus costaricensis TaxID=334426 RepID=A0A0R3PLC5_ANGCS|nr:unnamed protein product [Angiostrongylus costaricensis]
MASIIKLSSRGVRSLHPANFRSPWPFVKKGAYGQRKIGPFNYEKHKWPGQNHEFPELSPKWHKENPKDLHRLKPYVSFRTDVEIEKRSRTYAAKVKEKGSQVLADLYTIEDERWPPPKMDAETLFELCYGEQVRHAFKHGKYGPVSKTTECRRTFKKRLKAVQFRMSALLILADGAEEMEAVITADVLRRGGVDVTVAGLAGSNPVKCSRKTVIAPDCALDDVLSKKFDIVILPGGQPGSNTLAASSVVGQVLKAHHDAGKYVAAICAAPIALKSHGIPTTLITSHPSVRKQLEEGGYKYSEDRVVVADRIVTSRGPGTAFEFALKLVELLVGVEKSKELVAPMLLKL